MTRLAWLAVLLLGASAGAQDLKACGGEAGYPAWVKNGVYSGQIGKLPITLQINRQNPDQTAYFYDSKGVNIELAPFHTGEQLILQESGWNSAEWRQIATGCLTLTQSGANLTGRWTKPDATSPLAVKLTPLNVAAVPLRLPSSPGLLKLRQSDPLAFLKFNRPWVKVAGGYKEPYSGLFYPRLTPATPALNAFLQDQQLQYAAETVDCTSLAGGSSNQDMWFNVNPSFQFQTPQLLSVLEAGDAYCGGAHPSLIFSAYTVNKATAKPFKPGDLWPKLTDARLQQMYSKQLAATDKECHDATFDEFTAPPNTMLTAKGLAIYSDNYPEVARSCRTVDVTIPYAALKAEANPKSPYYRDIYR